MYTVITFFSNSVLGHKKLKITRLYLLFLQFVEHMVRTLKDSLKACNWDGARYALRFLADLVNCYVIAANSLLQLLDNLLDVAKEDGVPNVS